MKTKTKWKNPTFVNGKPTYMYTRWRRIRQRCSPAFWIHAPKYHGCVLDPRWEDFDVFCDWLKANGGLRPGYAVDKDILFPGNKVYGPDTCLIVPQSINNLLPDRGAARGDLPIGVSPHGRKYQSCYSVDGVNQYIGLYDTVNAAACAYLLIKSEHITDVALEQECPRLREGLLRHATIRSIEAGRLMRVLHLSV